jgi:hypothetical protein
VRSVADSIFPLGAAPVGGPKNPNQVAALQYSGWSNWWYLACPICRTPADPTALFAITAKEGAQQFARHMSVVHGFPTPEEAAEAKRQQKLAEQRRETEAAVARKERERMERTLLQELVSKRLFGPGGFWQRNPYHPFQDTDP